jgi:hypothetical protein
MMISHSSTTAVAMAGAFLMSTESVAADSPAARTRADSAATARQLAQCYLEGGRKVIEAALVADPLSMSFERWQGRRDMTCNSEVMFKNQVWILPYGDMMRYALSEELIRVDLKGIPLRNVTAVPPLQHKRSPLKFHAMTSRQHRAEANERQAAGIYLSALGECIVRTDPETARSLLDSDAASDSETAAFNKLMPSVQRCIDRSQTVQLDKDNLRGTIALNYYRLAKAAQALEGVVH